MRADAVGLQQSEDVCAPRPRDRPTIKALYVNSDTGYVAAHGGEKMERRGKENLPKSIRCSGPELENWTARKRRSMSTRGSKDTRQVFARPHATRSGQKSSGTWLSSTAWRRWKTNHALDREYKLAPGSGVRRPGRCSGLVFGVCETFSGVSIFQSLRITDRSSNLRSADQIARGDLTTASSIRSPDEIGHLAETSTSWPTAAEFSSKKRRPGTVEEKELELARTVRKRWFRRRKSSSGPIQVVGHFQPATRSARRLNGRSTIYRAIACCSSSAM